MPAHGKPFDVDDELYIGPEDCSEDFPQEESASPASGSKQSNRSLNRTLSWLDGFCIVYVLTHSYTHSFIHSYSPIYHFTQCGYNHWVWNILLSRRCIGSSRVLGRFSIIKLDIFR